MIVIYITADNLVSHENEDRAPALRIRRVLNKRLSPIDSGELGESVIEETFREYRLIFHTSRVLVYQEMEALK